MTQNQYVQKRLTGLDHVLFYSWLLPTLTFLALMVSIMIQQGHPIHSEYSYINAIITLFFGIGTIVTVICRSIYGYRVNQYIKDYEDALHKEIQSSPL